MASLLQDLRATFSGEQHDYTTLPLNRAIILLATPMILETLMESLFAIVDIFWVARLGEDAVAVVGLTESLMSTVFAIAMGLCYSTTAFVARRIGEKDPVGAAAGAMQSLYIGAAVSVVVGVLGAVFAEELLAMMGAPAGVQKLSSFTRILLGGSGTVVFLFLSNAIFRGAGDAVVAMKVLWFANAINLVLNPCLILGLGPFPEMGVAGSALGTTIGRGCGVLYQFWLLSGRSSRLQIRRDQMALDPPLLWRILKPSFSGMFQIFIATASWSAMVRIAAVFGASVLAGYTLAVRIVIFTILPAWGLGNAAATLVGQNLGAKRPDRAEASVWQASFFNAGYMGLCAIAFVTLPEFLLGFFTKDPAVLSAAVASLQYFGYAYVFLGFGVTMEQAFNGAGDTYTPTWINLFTYWLLQIPLAYLLAITKGWGPVGVFTAIAIAEVSAGVIAIWLFRRGKWKLQKV